MIRQCSLGTGAGRWILAATTLASATAFLAGTAVPIALPAVQSAFATSVGGIQWVINAQLLSLGALLLIGGSLGDRFGRKRVFISGISVFSLAALLSGLAPGIGWLVAFQALQGIGAALMVPQSLAIINDCFVESERGRAIGLWAGISGGIAAAGPLLGGWMVDLFSWRAAFLMVLPVSASAILVTALAIPRSGVAVSRRLDWPGTALIFLGLLGLAYGLISGPAAGWSEPSVTVSLAAGLIALALFLLVEHRQREPLVPFAIFRNPLVAGANAVTLALYFALNGVIFFTVLNLQQLQGYTPTAAGLSLLPPILLIAVFSGPAGALADKIGPRLPMVLGPAIVALGVALLAAAGAGADYLKHFLPGLSLAGAGMALVIAPLTKCALSVEPRFSGAASGVNNAVARIAGLLAVAVLGAVAVSVFAAHLTDVVSQSGLTVSQQRQVLLQADRLGGITVPEGFDAAARMEASQAIDGSLVMGFRWAMIVSAALALASAVVSYFTIRNAPPEPAQPTSG